MQAWAHAAAAETGFVQPIGACVSLQGHVVVTGCRCIALCMLTESHHHGLNFPVPFPPAHPAAHSNNRSTCINSCCMRRWMH